MKSLKNKVAVVTGAASGIGRALSVALAREGCRLALSDLEPEGLRETARTIENAGGVVITSLTDVANAEEMRSFAGEVIERFGQVDILVNNAGIANVAMIDEGSRAGFERVMNVNFWGVFNGVTAFLPHMKRQPSAHIVNISSVFGLWGIPSQAAYNCSKFAVRALSESLAQELSGSGITVSCVYPGGVKTNIAKGAKFEGAFGPFKDKEAFTRLFDEHLAFTTSEKAADVMVKGIKAGSARIRIGPDAYLMDFTQRLFPALYQKIIPTVLKLKFR
ncbi:MAG: SDR family oxidoreductase [Thermodesulfobacteriota bacterium]